MNSLSKENYLKALFHLANHKNEILVKDLSDTLGIRMPSVNSMMKKFAAEGWVVFESYKPIILTEEGRRKAALIVRKHRLTEMFLVEKMGFGWEQVHNIAEELEHIQSEQFFDKIDQLLNFPKADPHGSPIPDKEGNIIKTNYFKLSECEEGSQVKFVALNSSSDDFLRFLNNKKLALGTEIQILETESFDKSKKVSYDGITETFSIVVLEKILVEKL
ncbi:metal-dependent transcriptional regulator [Elizabethkingia sp. JS20170427COW]|uniref:metal-dependent transcriptional regulator n=1 Tax=Elizabethkingia sp. JS20170427COW TaxID=2583851 RepID=UPI001110272D|nr:metal-dependent transcriptional regulator [Elizabethkingia sp. JS20170427COW]QCX54312.1 metal-dependent transcriptional regulator [Elizabethkingia sp. JS20170427COW]